MHYRHTAILIGVFLLLSAGHSFAAKGSGGIASPSSNLEFELANPKHRLAPLPPLKIPIDDLTIITRHELIKSVANFENSGHTINGVALRNRTSGTIHLRGVPLPSQVKKAFLYWNFSDNLEIGHEYASILINGNRVNGKKVADNEDPCWGETGNHTYRANVTPYVPLTRPNEDYHVVPQFNQTTSTTGQNPWSSFEAKDIRLEGAWLVVIFENKATQGNQVALYDDLSNTEFSGTLNLSLLHPTMGAGPALFSMAGADGQRGSGHNNSAANELSFFNDIQIAGPPVSNSDWDGSDGWPLPQLSDTHTRYVKLNQTNIGKVRYVSNGDCLVPVAFVIEGQ